MKPLGFVGLGSMGGALACALAEHVPVMAFDRAPEMVRRVSSSGIAGAASLGELGAACETVITCLPTSDDVRGALFGAAGLAAALPPGALVIDSTSGHPGATKMMAQELRQMGIAFADAPVSGGPQAVAAGSIAIIVGGDVETYQRVRALYEHISPNIFHAGEVGSGHCVKALNNLLAAGHRLLAFEMTALATANGVDPRTFIDIVNASSGRSYATMTTLPRHVFAEPLRQGFSLGLASKDVDLACSLFEADPSESLAKTVQSRLHAALSVLGPSADVNELIRLFEAAAGVEVAVETADRAASTG